jgi:MraZ protein
MILIGQYSHTVDNKNRIFLPAKLRTGVKTFIITNGLDRCLYVYPEERWNGIVEKFDGISLEDKGEERAFKRAFLSEAVEVRADSLGRIVIPSKMLSYIGGPRSVVIVGVWKRLEIWSANDWDAYSMKARQTLEKISHKLEI